MKTKKCAFAGLLLLAGLSHGFAQAPQASPTASSAASLPAATPVATPAPVQTSVPDGTATASPTATPGETAAAMPAGMGMPPAINPGLGRITPWLGLSITAIRGVSSSPLDAPLRELPLQTGDRLQKLTLRQAVRRMYDSQRFSDIQVEAERSGDGVALTFLVVPNFFVGAIHVLGAAHPPNEIQLINATKLQPGAVFDQAEAERAIEGIQRLLQDNGDYQARTKLEIERQPEVQQVNLTYRVTRGKPVRIGQVTVSGDTGYSAARILRLAKLHPRSRVTADLANRSVARLRSRYEKEGRLEAKLSVTRGDYHPQTNTLDYLVNVERGPKIDISLQGAKLSRGQMKRYIPVYQENALDSDLLNEGARNLREYFQSQGFFDVAVNYEYQPAKPGETQTVVYRVEKGKKHKVVEVAFDGNHYFPNSVLEEHMQVEEADLLDRQGRFNSAMLASDVRAIESLYRVNGFQDVKVASEVLDDYKGAIGHIKVLVHVQEGEQVHVGTLTIAGNRSFTREQLESLLTCTSGQPFSDTDLANDREALANFYYDAGFPAVQVESTAAPDPGDTTRRDVTVTIHEGEEVFVDQVLVSGLRHAHEWVVSDSLKIHPGDPLSQNRMIDTEHSIYNLGIFNAANLAVQNPDGHALEKKVLLQLDEASRYTFSYGLGFEIQTGQVNNCTNHLQVVGQTLTLVPNQQGKFCSPTGSTGVSPQGTFDVSRINFRGRDQNLIFQSSASTLQQRVLGGLEIPHFRHHDGLKFSLTALYDKTQSVLTFNSSRIEGTVQLRQKLDKANTLLYRFSYRRVTVDANTLQVSPDQIPLLSRPVRVGGPGITYIRDTRDSPLDSHKGAYNTLDLSFAGSAFGSESSFGRLSLQNSSYYRLSNNKNEKKNWILARSLQLGVVEPFGAGTQSVVPLPEEFFTGGTSSHRGFSLNQAGPRDPNTGFPIGGNALFVNSIELRTPPLPLPATGDNLSVVLFHDFGNVFDTARDLFTSFLKVRQDNLGQCLSTAVSAPPCDFNFMSHALGTGARYHTPIGPIRFDVSYNLNPPYFPIKVVFDPTTEQARALDHTGRFNFFFSIGQTF